MNKTAKEMFEKVGMKCALNNSIAKSWDGQKNE